MFYVCFVLHRLIQDLFIFWVRNSDSSTKVLVHLPLWERLIHVTHRPNCSTLIVLVMLVVTDWCQWTSFHKVASCLTPTGAIFVSSQLLKTHGSSCYIQKLDYILSCMSFLPILVRVRVWMPWLPQKPWQPAPTTRPLPNILMYYYSPQMAYVSPREYYNVCSFLPLQSTPRRCCWSIGPSSEPLILPWSPSWSSETLGTIGSVWRSMSSTATRGQLRLARQRGPFSSPHLCASIL